MSPREEVLSLVDTSVRKGPNGNQGRGGSQTLDLRGAYAFMQRPYGRQGRPGPVFLLTLSLLLRARPPSP